MPNPLILRVLPVVIGAVAAVAKKPLQRNDVYIKTLKRFDWEPEHPPAGFSEVYAYTLVEYALGDEENKSEALLELFAEPEIKDAFQQAFEQCDGGLLAAELDKRIDWQDFGNEWNLIGNAIREQTIDIQQEAKVFFAVFLNVVRRSQTPKEKLQTFLLANVQQELKELRLQLAQAADADLIAGKVAKQVKKLLPGVEIDDAPKAHDLADQLDAWFKVLGYGRESHNVDEGKYFEWIITIPVRRRRNDRIVVRGVTGEAGMADLKALAAAVAEHNTDGLVGF